MTSNTIITYRLVVNIRMAGDTIHGCLIKNKGSMALFAVYLRMGAFQLKIGGIVVELKAAVIHFPSCRMVAFYTVHFQVVTMRRLG
jgi:hypothetical protein